MHKGRRGEGFHFVEGEDGWLDSISRLCSPTSARVLEGVALAQDAPLISGYLYDTSSSSAEFRGLVLQTEIDCSE